MVAKMTDPPPRARDGIRLFNRTNGTSGRTWRDLASQRANVSSFLRAAERGEVSTVFAKIDLDRNGNQIGDIIMEAW